MNNEWSCTPMTLSTKHMPDASLPVSDNKPWSLGKRILEIADATWDKDFNGYRLSGDFHLHHHRGLTIPYNRLDWMYGTPAYRHVGMRELYNRMYPVVSEHHLMAWSERYINGGFYRTSLERQTKSMKSHLDHDWVTNFHHAQVHLYEPIDYVTYCKNYLTYDPIPKEVELNWWGTYTYIFDAGALQKPTRYAVDDHCKALLAEMLPVPTFTTKRIYNGNES